MTAPDPLVRLAEVSNPAAARVYAALLDSAGIPVQLRGEALGPYVMAAGDWAITDIWVPESAWDDAVDVLAGDEPTPDLRLLGRPDPPDGLELERWAGAAVIALALAGTALWLLVSRF
jgi:hypothetical protein